MKPSAKQLKFMNWEFGMFFHFGIRTFNHGHRDWDNIDMDVKSFNPSSLDCEQWIKIAKDVGCKYAVLTTKHHDGFAMWPSKYTEYSVKNSPWKNGNGDVVKEFCSACRNNDIAVGLYYSPAQWGKSSISFAEEREYDDYFINQISELLTNYGKIDYLWFDGCGSANHKYDEKRIINVIRNLQKDIIIFGMWDPDTAWVGNEDGYAPIFNPCEGEYLFFGKKKKSFMPLECDCRLHGTWFYDPLSSFQIKMVDELIGMYELSVGRGANLLLNVGPNEEGIISREDETRLYELKAEIEKRYGEPLGYEKVNKISNDTFTIEYSKEMLNETFGDTENIPLVRSVIINEDITSGVNTRKFKLYAHIPSRNPISETKYCVFSGETIGRKYICRFPAVRSPKFTLVIEKQMGETNITSIKAFG